MEQAELIERQIEREEEMRGEGIARYLKNTAMRTCRDYARAR